MTQWDASYTVRDQRPDGTHQARHERHSVVAWTTGPAPTAYVSNGQTFHRADKPASADTTLDGYEPAESPDERLVRWLTDLDRQTRATTGKPALLAVELATGRRFDGRLGGGDGATHPAEFIGFIPGGEDSGATMYVRLAAISMIRVLTEPSDGPAASDMPS